MRDRLEAERALGRPVEALRRVLWREAQYAALLGALTEWFALPVWQPRHVTIADKLDLERQLATVDGALESGDRPG